MDNYFLLLIERKNRNNNKINPHFLLPKLQTKFFLLSFLSAVSLSHNTYVRKYPDFWLTTTEMLHILFTYSTTYYKGSVTPSQLFSTIIFCFFLVILSIVSLIIFLLYIDRRKPAKPVARLQKRVVAAMILKDTALSMSTHFKLPSRNPPRIIVHTD